MISNADQDQPARLRHSRQRPVTRPVPLKIAVLLGDDLHAQLPHLQSITDMFNGAPPAAPVRTRTSAYLGAPGIAQALKLGADIIITGRVVDSAVVSAALVHEFNWSGRITTASPKPHGPGISSNAAPSAPAATSPTGATCRTRHTSVSHC